MNVFFLYVYINSYILYTFYLTQYRCWRSLEQMYKLGQRYPQLLLIIYCYITNLKRGFFPSFFVPIHSQMDRLSVRLPSDHLWSGSAVIGPKVIQLSSYWFRGYSIGLCRSHPHPSLSPRLLLTPLLNVSVCVCVCKCVSCFLNVFMFDNLLMFHVGKNNVLSF